MGVVRGFDLIAFFSLFLEYNQNRYLQWREPKNHGSVLTEFSQKYGLILFTFSEMLII